MLRRSASFTILFFAVPTAALAQSGTMTVQIVSVGGVDHGPTPLPADACSTNQHLDLALSTIPDSGTELDFWRGSSCNLVAQRVGTSSCHFLASVSRSIGSRPTEELTGIAIQDLLEGLSPVCPTSGSSSYQIYVLATSSTASTDDVGTGYGVFTLAFDFGAPPTPTSVSVGTGETELPISWTESTDATDVAEFRLYVDDTVDETCHSTVLVRGAAVTSALDQRGAASGDSRSFSLRGVPVGTHVAVAIAAVDDAGNVSPLSEVACGLVANTDGFWDRYQQRGGQARACSVSHVQAGSPAPFIAVLSGTAFAFTRRRKRRPTATPST